MSGDAPPFAMFPPTLWECFRPIPTLQIHLQRSVYPPSSLSSTLARMGMGRREERTRLARRSFRLGLIAKYADYRWAFTPSGNCNFRLPFQVNDCSTLILSSVARCSQSWGCPAASADHVAFVEVTFALHVSRLPSAQPRYRSSSLGTSGLPALLVGVLPKGLSSAPIVPHSAPIG